MDRSLRNAIPPSPAIRSGGPRLLHRAAGVVILLTAAATLACNPRTHSPEPPLPFVFERQPTRGVILISLDTLRADHLSTYGYERETSPFLTELAARGVRFDQAISQYPSTLTSHMSLFTGLYPGEHGVYPPDHVLSDTIATLPELLRAVGYRTGGFTEGAFVAGGYGFARGFDVFDDEAARQPDDIERTFGRAREFLRGLDEDEDFFLFLHTYEIHDPYDPPEPYASMFWDRPVPETFFPDAANLVNYNLYGGELPAGTVDYFRALYDGSIRYADDQLRALFAEIAELGLDRDLTVVVLSDHGEQFLEHGQFVHADIYQETMRVPLIVVQPALPAGTVVPWPVRLIDVAPTLLDLLGTGGAETMSGRSLVGDAHGRAPDVAHAYSETENGNSRGLHVRHEDGLRHLVVHRRNSGDWIGRHYSIDLADDVRSVTLQSWEAPRRARLSLADGWSTEAELLPAPSTTTVEVPPGRGRRLGIDAADCTPLADRDNVCFAFRIVSPTAQRTELFDPVEDPLEQEDLAGTDAEAAAAIELRDTLLEIQHQPLGARLQRALGDDLTQTLRVLGYL